MKDRTFAKSSFFKVDPAWRRRGAYSTIGTRGDVDLVLLGQSPNLDDPGAAVGQVPSSLGP